MWTVYHQDNIIGFFSTGVLAKDYCFTQYAILGNYEKNELSIVEEK